MIMISSVLEPPFPNYRQPPVNLPFCLGEGQTVKRYLQELTLGPVPAMAPAKPANLVIQRVGFAPGPTNKRPV